MGEKRKKLKIDADLLKASEEYVRKQCRTMGLPFDDPRIPNVIYLCAEYPQRLRNMKGKPLMPDKPLICWYCSRLVVDCKKSPCEHPDYPVTVFRMKAEVTNA